MTKVFNRRLKKAIDKHDVISFDIFDTLIKRNCLNPTDIFDICEKRYNNTTKQKISDFKEERIRAEKEARDNTNKEEICIDEIYEKIKCDNLNKKEMQKIEIDTEIDFCMENIPFKDIYNYCLKNNKRILFVSDMYLKEDTIKKILEKSGYTKGKLYLSSKYNVSKYSGGLFKIVLEKERIKPKQLLHIGDSKKADFLMPILLHANAYKINRREANTSYISLMDDTISNNILYSFVNNNVCNMNEYEKIGYELLGPICYSFCNWVHKKASINKINNLLFCARDMKFIQEAYDYIYGDKAIDNKYFYVSRKSLKLPYLYKNNDFNSFFIMIPDKKMKMEDILRNFNINIDKKVLEEYGYDKEEYNCFTLKNDDNFLKFYNEIIRKEIVSNKETKNQYDNFINYLNDMNFDKNSAIVDLGWKGTTQYSITKTLNSNIYGMYFGQEKNAFKELDDYSSTFLFNKNDDGVIEDKVYSFRSLFEIMFASTDGSTIKYTNNKSKPYVLGEPDNYDNAVLKAIQNSAIKFIKDFNKLGIELDNPSQILDNFIRIGIKPTYKESIIFGDLRFDNMIDGFLAKPKKLFYYVFHPFTLKKDVFSSEWKIGFMKRLFKVELPYYSVYNRLKKIKNGGNNL